MSVNNFLLILNLILGIKAYTNILYSISEQVDHNISDLKCKEYVQSEFTPYKFNENDTMQLTMWSKTTTRKIETTTTANTVERDPMDTFQNIMHNFFFGKPSDDDVEGMETAKKVLSHEQELAKSIPDHYPSGNILRGEIYQNRSGVHLTMPELLHRGHCRLKVTMDFMQTAVNAFSIFLVGDLIDILQLPALYVLHSARSISMMNIAREKLAATWTVVKDNKRTDEVTIETLELYRPLFKYLNGKEIAKLNLTNPRILVYVGTHAELNRHQVGVVASRYIKINKRWSEPKYLNMMNNLLCGVPMTFMRKVPENTYLQLSHQVFYHIQACDPLQRRFYLAMMTKSQALGKSYSWNARDVSRLGLLLAEVEGPDLSAINPEAMAGITAHVMSTMDPQNLIYFTDSQLKFLPQKPLNILTRKLKTYEDRMKIYNGQSVRMRSAIITSPFTLLYLLFK